MTVLSVIVNGTEQQLDNGAVLAGTSKIYWQGEQGAGLSTLQRLTRRGPRQHGDFDFGFRLEPRDFREIFYVLAESWGDMYDGRERLLDLFKPTVNNLTLKWLLPNAEERRIDCYASGGLQLDSAVTGGPFGKNVIVEFRAPDPLLYDPEEIVVQFRTEDIDDLGFPIGFPIGFGSSIVSGGQAIGYQGNFPSFPVIKLTGPMAAPKIENTSITEKIELGSTLAGGETRTIDLTPGAKTIVDEAGANAIGELTNDSDLGTFRLEVDPIVANGTNSILISAGGATAASLIEIRYFDRYVGL